MLRELHINNLAVIEDACITLGPGLNVFTGQTGAGKSLVLGAFEILLGRRRVGNLLRPGAAEGRVTGLFEISDAEVWSEIQRVADLPLEDISRDDEPLIVVRKLFASGRSSVAINGHPVTTAMLQAVGNLLIDLQSASTSSQKGAASSASISARQESHWLSRPAYQLQVLDAFAGLTDAVAEYGEVYRQWRALQQRHEELTTGATLRLEQLDLCRFQAGEIDEVDPTPEEYQELLARSRVLSNIQRLERDGGTVYNLLYEGEGAVTERAQYAVAILREIVELDEDLRESLQLTETGVAALQDASFTLGRYINRLELNPGELDEVNDRLNALNRLIAKYGHGRVEDVLEFRQQLQARIEELGGAAEDVDDLAQQIGHLAVQLDGLAEKLHMKRKAAVGELRPLIEAELHELAMQRSEFDIHFETLPSPGPTGRDRMEMMIRTNPGQPMRPMREIASGGELSRAMLALKTVLAHAEGTSVLVFDEIDAKIGGRLGTVIGGKLQTLARSHQVLCITHLPQIAAYADHHLKIVKSVEDDETRATVMTLDDVGDRIDELAEMLAGVDATDVTRKQARELVDRAQASRQGQPEIVVKSQRPATTGPTRASKPKKKTKKKSAKAAATKGRKGSSARAD